MKKLIFWDLDGTLIDTLEDLGAAVNHALALRGLPQLGTEDFRKMVGHGVRNLVAQALEASVTRTGEASGSGTAADVRDDAYIDSALADFKEYYCSHIDVFTRPYPGIPELLSELSDAGVKMAVVSNKFQEGTEYLVKEFFPNVPFVAILGNRPGWPLKPSPEIVEDVLRRVAGGGGGPGGTRRAGSCRRWARGLEPCAAPAPSPCISRADAVLVGDSPTDMRTAANGGIDAIAVAWGYRSPEELAAFLASPSRIARSVEELRHLLTTK